MKKAFLILTIIISFSFKLYSNSLYFLKDVDVKNADACMSLSVFSDDSFSQFTNPANLALLKKQELGFVYINLFGFSTLSSGSFAYPIYERGSFAISGIILSTDEIEERNEINQVIGKFSDAYKVLNISYGLKIIDFLSAGLNLKYIYHNFYSSSSSAYGLDAGILLNLPFDIKMASVLFNLAKPVFEYQSNLKDILPLESIIAIGKNFRIVEGLSDNFKVAAGMNLEEFKNEINVSFALEYSVFNAFALRTGLKGENFTIGATFSINNININYAFVKMPFDFNHRLSLTVNYGENIRQMEELTKTKEAKIKQELINKIKLETIKKYKTDIEDFIKKEDLENAKVAVEKALAWDTNDNWFREKEKQINELIKDNKIKELFTESDDFIKKELYVDAMVRLKSILDIDPENKTAKEKFKLAEEYVKTLGEKNMLVEEKNRGKIKKHFEKGLAYYTSEDYEAAIKEWNEVIKSSPLQRQIYNYIKAAEEKIRKKEEQKKTVELLRKQKITELYNKAVLEYTKGNFETSINYWRELLKLDPENKEAKENIDKIVEDYKKLQKQEIMW